MRTSEKGIDLIKIFEGLRLSTYQDAAGINTIGFGTTEADYSITHRHIDPGLAISKTTAETWLLKCIEQKYEPLVEKYDKIYHWNQNQFDALVSFAYNIGSIDQLTDYGKRDIDTITRKILAYNKAGGKVNAGLARRRKAEHDLFTTPCKEGYKGTFPALPPRGWYKYGDGITKYKEYKTQIKRMQKLIAWILEKELDPDGKYGKATEEAVKDLQGMFKLEKNGKFGNKCLAKAKAYKK